MTDLATEIDSQKVFVQKFIKDKADPDRLNRLNGDMLSYVLVQLAGFYEYNGAWLARENKEIQDVKGDIHAKYAQEFLIAREQYPIEHSKQYAALKVAYERKELNERKGQYDEILAWKKSLSKYIDIVRSQFSYEKSLAQNITAGN